MEKQGLALVLSGGAAKGVVHLGVLQALDEEGIKPAVISGVSAGAIVGAFYCYGYSPKEVMKIVKDNSILKFLRPAWGTGLLKLDKAEKIFREYLKIELFEELAIPLFISACDVKSTNMLTFSEGEIIPPLLGSCSLPPIFKPIEFNGVHLADGGILNNLPVEPVKNYSKIIGVNSNSIKDRSLPDGLSDYTEWVANVIVNINITESIKHCHVYLEPPEMKDHSFTDIAKADEFFTIGYNYTKKNMGSIHKLMDTYNDVKQG